MNILKIDILTYLIIKKYIKRDYAKKTYYVMSDEEMQKHKEYQKNYQKMYIEKEKHDLQNIKKEQGNFNKNAVLTLPKTKIES